MATPICLPASDVDDFNALLPAVFPEVASMCGAAINNATFAKTVCGLLKLAIREPAASPFLSLGGVSEEK
jgi:hypothetical protein